MNRGEPPVEASAPSLRQRWARHGFERDIKALLAPLYRAAYRLTGTEPEAEDLVQDTLVNAFRSFERDGCAAPADVRAWTFTILANRFRDRYRRERRSHEVSFAILDEDPDSNVIELVPSGDPGPVEAAEATEFRTAAQAAIDRLPPEVRLAVTLYFMEDCSYQKIADITGCPIGTVMSRLWRGRRSLRQALARFAADDGEEIVPVVDAGVEGARQARR
jgi:RNA polymerase sigma-70 factor (ECF subfamily)